MTKMVNDIDVKETEKNLKSKEFEVKTNFDKKLADVIKENVISESTERNKDGLDLFVGLLNKVDKEQSRADIFEQLNKPEVANAIKKLSIEALKDSFNSRY